MRPAALLVSVLSLAGLGVVRADDATPIRTKLEKALATYEKDLEVLDKAMVAIEDKRGAAARAAGDKKALDLLKTERETWIKTNAPPSWVPTAQLLQRVAVRAAAVAAYETAVKEYTKKGLDDEAAAAEKQRQEFEGKAAVLMCFDQDVRDSKSRTSWKLVLKFYSNMTCESFDKGKSAYKATWSLKKDELEIRWVGKSAGDVIAVDRCRMGKDGVSYTGTCITRPSLALQGKRIPVPKDVPADSKDD